MTSDELIESLLAERKICNAERDAAWKEYNRLWMIRDHVVVTKTGGWASSQEPLAVHWRQMNVVEDRIKEITRDLAAIRRIAK